MFFSHPSKLWAFRTCHKLHMMQWGSICQIDTEALLDNRGQQVNNPITLLGITQSTLNIKMAKSQQFSPIQFRPAYQIASHSLLPYTLCESTFKIQMIPDFQTTSTINNCCSTIVPHWSNLSWVDHLFLKANQLMEVCLGIAVKYQMIFHQLTSGNLLLIPDLEGIRMGLSFSAISSRGSLLWMDTRTSDLAGFQCQTLPCSRLDTVVSKLFSVS